MATYGRTKKGVSVIEMTDIELIVMTGNIAPVCGMCNGHLTGGKIILVPILNDAYCPKCAAFVEGLNYYPEDAEIMRRRDEYYKHELMIEDGGK